MSCATLFDVVIYIIINGFGCLNSGFQDLSNHQWRFLALLMGFDAQIVSLGPTAWYYSTKNYSQGIETHTYCSKSLNRTHIFSNRPMVPLRGHMWLVDGTFLAT